jgi:signal transduction histidine kinase
VQAAASAAALALDNERLKADLRARLEELRHSRRRIVEAADDARRQIERDLHDGAQQQLVSLALDLRLLRARLKHEPELAETGEELADKLATALAELRELARGIHPAVLSDHGLGPAIHVLVERSPISVECDLAFDERLPAPVEAAAYFVAAEGLTNVIKYANAEKAKVNVRLRGDAVEVVVSDDGVGGARIDAGSGLRGLSDRLAALEGELEVDSPLGEGTRLVARIPLTGPT